MITAAFALVMIPLDIIVAADKQANDFLNIFAFFMSNLPFESNYFMGFFSCLREKAIITVYLFEQIFLFKSVKYYIVAIVSVF